MIPKTALLPVLVTRPQLSYHMAEVIIDRKQRMSRGNHNQAVGFITERVDHFFRVDQLLRKHATNIENHAVSEMRSLMW